MNRSLPGPQLELSWAKNYFCNFRNRSTSRAEGIDGCAPWRVTEIAATADAYRAASRGFLPNSRLTANPALKASPAAVESTAFTANDGTISRVASPQVPVEVATYTPCAPILMTTFFDPRASTKSAQRSRFAFVRSDPCGGLQHTSGQFSCGRGIEH